MPRIARKKSNDSIYHVMCRSISEVKLLKDEEDKLKYMQLIKKYMSIFKFKIYAYCLMDNHVHLIMDSNGSDISQIMHGINFSYANYFNKKYRRHGHLFQDRFLSKTIDSDRYLLTASGYIHNNPTKYKGFKRHPEKYRFSSLAPYLGLCEDPFDLLDSGFVLALFGEDPEATRQAYYKFIFDCDDEEEMDIEFTMQGTEYLSRRVILSRCTDTEQVLDYVANGTGFEKALLHVKFSKHATAARALLVMILKSACGLNAPQVCNILGNITQANVSRLVHLGIGLLERDLHFRTLFEGGIVRA